MGHACSDRIAIRRNKGSLFSRCRSMSVLKDLYILAVDFYYPPLYRKQGLVYCFCRQGAYLCNTQAVD